MPGGWQAGKDAGEMEMGLTAGKEAVFREDSNGIDYQDDNFGEDFVSEVLVEDCGDVTPRELSSYRREASLNRKETSCLPYSILCDCVTYVSRGG